MGRKTIEEEWSPEEELRAIAGDDGPDRHRLLGLLHPPAATQPGHAPGLGPVGQLAPVAAEVPHGTLEQGATAGGWGSPARRSASPPGAAVADAGGLDSEPLGRPVSPLEALGGEAPGDTAGSRWQYLRLRLTEGEPDPHEEQHRIGTLWRYWQDLWRRMDALSASNLSEEIAEVGRLIGYGGDCFARWLGCTPAQLVTLTLWRLG